MVRSRFPISLFDKNTLNENISQEQCESTLVPESRHAPRLIIVEGKSRITIALDFITLKLRHLMV